MPEELDYDDAMAILCGWEGRAVLVIAFVDPGVSLRPFGGILSVTDDDHGMLHAEVTPGPDTQPVRLAFPSGLFHDAVWVPGLEGRGLSIEQGATRVDVFLEE
jgi:hypothetical protein